MASSSDNDEDSDFIPSDGENEISNSEEDSLVSDTECVNVYCNVVSNVLLLIYPIPFIVSILINNS